MPPKLLKETHDPRTTWSNSSQALKRNTHLQRVDPTAPKLSKETHDPRTCSWLASRRESLGQTGLYKRGRRVHFSHPSLVVHTGRNWEQDFWEAEVPSASEGVDFFVFHLHNSVGRGAQRSRRPQGSRSDLNYICTWSNMRGIDSSSEAVDFSDDESLPLILQVHQSQHKEWTCPFSNPWFPGHVPFQIHDFQDMSLFRSMISRTCPFSDPWY